MEGERRDVLRFSPGHCERFEGQDALRFGETTKSDVPCPKVICPTQK